MQEAVEGSYDADRFASARRKVGEKLGRLFYRLGLLLGFPGKLGGRVGLDVVLYVYLYCFGVCHLSITSMSSRVMPLSPLQRASSRMSSSACFTGILQSASAGGIPVSFTRK